MTPEPTADRIARLDLDEFSCLRNVMAYAGDCVDAGRKACQTCLLAAEVRELRNELKRTREEHRWIPVEERTPCQWQLVLFDKHVDQDGASDSDGGTAVYDNGFWNDGHTVRATHWQPFPQFPPAPPTDEEAR